MYRRKFLTQGYELNSASVQYRVFESNRVYVLNQVSCILHKIVILYSNK